MTLLSPTRSASTDGAYSGVLGHQFLISNTTVNAFRVTVNRGLTPKHVPLLDYNDIGVKATPVLPEYLRLSVSGGFSMSPGLPTATPTLVPGLGRPEHPSRRSPARVRRELHLLEHDPESHLRRWQHVVQRWRDRAGARRFHDRQSEPVHGWHPDGGEDALQLHRPIRPGQLDHVSERDAEHRPSMGSLLSSVQRAGPDHAFRSRALRCGLKSSVFRNAPAGLIFTGDEGMPGKSVARRDP